MFRSTRLVRAFAGLFVALTAAAHAAQPGQIENGSLNPRDPSRSLHLEPVDADGWRAAGKGTVRFFQAAGATGTAVVLHDGGSVSQDVTMPKAAGGESCGVLSVDVLGRLAGDGDAIVRLQVLEAGTDAVLAAADLKTLLPEPLPAPHAEWGIAVSSRASGGEGVKAIDDNAATMWHSSWGADTPRHPHWATIDLGRKADVAGLRYLPRQSGGVNGTVRAYGIYVSDDGKSWSKPVAEGEFQYGEDGRDEQTVVFPTPVSARFVKFEARSEIKGGPWASAAEVTPLVEGDAGADAESAGAESAPEKAILGLPSELVRKLAEKTVVFRISGVGSRPVVVDNADLRVYRLGEGSGHSNWKQDVFDVDAGALGFKGVSWPGQAFLPVFRVREESPAARAGLEPGDIIVGVNGAPMPAAASGPTPEFLRSSHEAVLGRAVEAVQSAGFLGRVPRPVTLTVLRNGTEIDVVVPLPESRRKRFAATFPFHCRQTRAMYEDIIGYILRNQQDDGHWNVGGDPMIQTAFSGLALLGTRNAEYASPIKAAADWYLRTHKHVGAEHSHWRNAYAGTFLCEYYLATGDERARDWAERYLKWLPKTTHMSWQGFPTLGHGPGGLPYGGKSLLGPNAQVLVFASLGKLCDVQIDHRDDLWKVLGGFVEASWSDPAKGGHGGMGYGPQLLDHGQGWNRTGLVGIAAHLAGRWPQVRDGMAGFFREYHYLMRNSHAYGLPGSVWGLVAQSQIDPDGFREVMQQWSWTFALAWEPGFGVRYSEHHMGAPYMGSEGLINPAYGTLLSVMHKGLFITGARDRNWLNVAHLPHAVSPVEITRDQAGNVTLECQLPGPPIRYTVDGTVPTTESTLYEEPVALPDGGLVTAVCEDRNGDIGPLSRAVFGASKAAWRIESGNKSGIDPQQGWARLAVDGNVDTWWQTGRWGHAVPPFDLTLDLGQPRMLTGLALHHRRDSLSGGNVKQYAVYVSADAGDWGEPVAEGILKGGRGREVIEFGRIVEARHIRLEALSSQAGWAFVCAAEVDIVQPHPELAIPDGHNVAITCRWPDYVIRCTTDGTLPTETSMVYKSPLAVPPGTPVIARCHKDKWLGPPVLLDVPTAAGIYRAQ